MPSTSLTTPRALAGHVLEAMLAEDAFQPTARPLDPDELDTTTWWLAPTTQWPAYRHGKFVFMPDPSDTGSMLAGLHVEKGLGPAAMAGMFSEAGRSLITTDDWLWSSFLEDLDGDIASCLTAIEQASGVPPVILLQATLIDPMAADGALPLRDEVRFAASGSSLSLIQTSVEQGLLADLAGCAGLNDLAGALAALPTEDWVWVDAYITVPFTAQPDAPVTWDGARIFDEILRPLLPWFR